MKEPVLTITVHDAANPATPPVEFKFEGDTCVLIFRQNGVVCPLFRIPAGTPEGSEVPPHIVNMFHCAALGVGAPGQEVTQALLAILAPYAKKLWTQSPNKQYETVIETKEEQPGGSFH